MIKPETFTSLRHMLNRELFVWSALSFHPHILHLQDVLQSSTRLYFITGEFVCWQAGTGTCQGRQAGIGMFLCLPCCTRAPSMTA